MLGGLDRPSAGNLSVGGKDLLKLTDKQLEIYKRETVGFVWQNSARNLIPYLTAQENVEVPMILRGRRKRDLASELLEMVGLGKRKKNKLGELSGGEQQRVAIAIAVANSPGLLLADEPTGSVDTATTMMILDVFNELNRVLGVTIVIVTHDLQISKKVERVVAIRDGRTSSEFIRKKSYREEMAQIPEQEEESHVELAVVDKVGRVQIPREYLDALGVKGNKIKIEQEDGRIVLIAPEEMEDI
jgi:ABC-type lipoprotein export system ATPase subunit